MNEFSSLEALGMVLAQALVDKPERIRIER